MGVSRAPGIKSYTKNTAVHPLFLLAPRRVHRDPYGRRLGASGTLEKLETKNYFKRGMTSWENSSIDRITLEWGIPPKSKLQPKYSMPCWRKSWSLARHWSGGADDRPVLYQIFITQWVLGSGVSPVVLSSGEPRFLH